MPSPADYALVMLNDHFWIIGPFGPLGSMPNPLDDPRWQEISLVDPHALVPGAEAVAMMSAKE